MKNYLLAIATLMGTIIGVGMFAMPYVIVKSGVLMLFIYMPVLACLQYYLHLLFSEVVLSTQGDKRLPGYVERYNGQTGKIVTLVMSLVSDYGVLLAYIIFGGLFLHQLLAPVFGGGVFVYASILFWLEALIVWRGLKLIAGVEFAMTGSMIFIIGLIVWRGWDFISLGNFNLVDWHYALYPYGPIFFSVGGMAAIPEVCKLLTDQKEKIKSAIAWGTFLSAIVMAVFVLAIVGMTGPNTTPDSLAGLGQIFSGGMIKLALIFGLLAVATSLISIAQACREIFWWDFKMNKTAAWVLACLVPYLIYLFGVQNLTKTVGLTGAFSGGALGIVVIYILLKIKKKSDQRSVVVNNINKTIAYSLSLLFILGIIYEIWAVIK